MAGRCKVGALAGIDSPLPHADRMTLGTWAAYGVDANDRPVSAERMSQALHAEGHPVGPTTCKDHRARRCACYRKDTDA